MNVAFRNNFTDHLQKPHQVPAVSPRYRPSIRSFGKACSDRNHGVLQATWVCSIVLVAGVVLSLTARKLRDGYNRRLFGVVPGQLIEQNHIE
jgi:hypothetical protein